MDVAVGKNTDLDAGKIVSDSGELKLSTDTLTYKNADGSDRYQGFDAGVGIDLSGGRNANHTLDGSYRLDDTGQSVEATVGPGQITVRDRQEQASLEQGGATAPLSDLNRDPARASTVTRSRHVNIEAYVSTDGLKAAAQAGKTLAETLTDAFKRMNADGKLSASDLRSAAGPFPICQ